jgi:hypothetical protein
MDDTTTTAILDQAEEEEILTCTVSDETLESAETGFSQSLRVGCTYWPNCP